MMRRIVVCLCLLFMAPRAYANEGVSLSDCERLYAQKKFPEAAAALQSFNAGSMAEDAIAHYLLGNVFVKLGKSADALREYNISAQLSRDPSLIRYCQTAMTELAGSGKASTPTVKPGLPGSNGVAGKGEISASKLGSTAGSAVGGKGSESTAKNDQTGPESKNAAQTSSEPVKTAESQEHEALHRSVRDISAGIDSASSGDAAENAARVKQINDAWAKRIELAEKAVNDRVAELQSNFFYDRFGGKRLDQESTDQLARVRSEWLSKRKEMEAQQKRELEEAQADYDERRRLLEEHALNTERQYKSSTSSIKLTPLGTNFYNQNYETMSEPTGGQVPLRVSSESMRGGLLNTPASGKARPLMPPSNGNAGQKTAEAGGGTIQQTKAVNP